MAAAQTKATPAVRQRGGKEKAEEAVILLIVTNNTTSDLSHKQGDIQYASKTQPFRGSILHLYIHVATTFIITSPVLFSAF